MSLGVGARLGHDAVTAKIGEGGMGEVYRARDTKLDRGVALNALPQDSRMIPTGWTGLNVKPRAQRAVVRSIQPGASDS